VLHGFQAPVAGTYRITIYFTHPGRAGNRTALVAVDGAPSATVSFSGGPICCSGRSINVSFVAGPHTISLANSTGEAPAIDRVVVS
jgi:hypothetical protein